MDDKKRNNAQQEDGKLIQMSQDLENNKDKV